LLEVLTAEPRALVDEQHVSAGLGGACRGGEPCGPAADDQHVGLDGQVLERGGGPVRRRCAGAEDLDARAVARGGHACARR